MSSGVDGAVCAVAIDGAAIIVFEAAVANAIPDAVVADAIFDRAFVVTFVVGANVEEELDAIAHAQELGPQHVAAHGLA
jgi:pentapeptide MXKDX repeat protein